MTTYLIFVNEFSTLDETLLPPTNIASAARTEDSEEKSLGMKTGGLGSGGSGGHWHCGTSCGHLGNISLVPDTRKLVLSNPEANKSRPAVLGPSRFGY